MSKVQSSGLGFFVVVAALLAAVPSQGQVKLDPKRSSSYFDAMPVQSDDLAVRQLIARAEAECNLIEQPCPPGEDLLRLLFQGSYRDNLPDFIVHLARDAETGRLAAHQPLLIFNRRNTPYLLGVEHLWVLVVADEEVPMTAQLTTIREREVNPFSGAMGVFGLTAGQEAPESETSAEAAELSWRELTASGPGDRPLFLGSARLPIENDIVCRVTLVPVSSEGLDFQSITGHISNSRSSAAAFSTALGATFDTADTTLVEENGDPAFNGYALAKFYFPGRGPRLEVSPRVTRRYRRSIGLVFGTNVSNDPFSEIVIGLSFGHLVGKAGLVIGGNAVEETGSNDRRWRPIVGVDFTF